MWILVVNGEVYYRENPHVKYGFAWTFNLKYNTRKT